MKQKVQTLVVGFAIILAAAVQTEVNQRLKARHAQPNHHLVLQAQAK